MRYSLPLLIASCCGTCPAQFQPLPATGGFHTLASTSDGSRVYFSTPLRQRGSAQGYLPKIFFIDKVGIHFLAETTTGGYNVLHDPSVSDDAAVTAYNGDRICLCCSSCLLSAENTASILKETGKPDRSFSGHLLVSRNGRFALLFSSPYYIPTAGLKDLLTGSSITFPPNLGVGVALSSGGASLFAGPRLILVDPTGKPVVLLPSNVTTGAMDDRAKTIVVETTQPRRLQILTDPSATPTPMGPPGRDSYAPSITNDGRTVAFLSSTDNGAQAFIASIPGGSFRQLTGEEPVVEVRMEGDGQRVFVSTSAGRLLRIDLPSGGVTELFAATPEIDGITALLSPLSVSDVNPGAASPGSRNELSGRFCEQPGATLDDQPLPVLNSSPAEISVQIPWEFRGDTGSQFTLPKHIIAVQCGDQNWEAAYGVTVAPVNPVAFPLGSPQPISREPAVALHGDFSGLVTESNPAQPGELIHMYFSGLGAVDPPAATGTPASASPLSRTVVPLQWEWSGRTSQTADVLYSGLAPGLIGVYQVDLRTPDQIENSSVTLFLRSGDSSWLVAFIPAAPSPR